MKTRILWAAAALVLLAGCQKSGGIGKEIRFSAVTMPEAATRTAYSGERFDGKERINWSRDDKIRIYSTEATCNNDDTYHWVDYSLSGITTPSSAKYTSEAGKLDVAHPSRGGLAWGDASTYHFYAIYPSPETEESAETVLGGAAGTPFPCTIPSSQVGSATEVNPIISGANSTVYYPSMSNAYMVAHDTKGKEQDINLVFEPAYTAFHISMGAPEDEAVTIRSAALISGGSGSPALAGAYSAYLDGSDWTYGITGTDHTVGFTFNGEDYTITAGETVEFVIFALPQELTNLTLKFVMAGGVTHSLALKVADNYTSTVTVDGVAYSAGEYLRFAACKKHYIRGSAIPGSSWTINNTTQVLLDEGVKPWTDIAPDLEYGVGGNPVVNATKLNYDATGNTGSFAIYAPNNVTWRIKALNASDSSVATGVTLTRTNVSPTVSSTAGVLEGITGDRKSSIEFSLSGPAGTYKLDFSIVIGDREYSINSEIRYNESIVLS